MAQRKSFYEDDEVTLPTPGLKTQIPKELEDKEKMNTENVQFVEGMTIRTIPYLETYLNKSRLYLHEKLKLYGAELETQKSALNNEVNNVVAHFNAVVVEPVLPNLIYILTASLTGSVLVNKRSLPVRFMTPLFLGTVAYRQFMPLSYANTTDRLYSVEERYPEIVNFHKSVAQGYRDTKVSIDNSLNDGNVELQRQVHNMRMFLKDIFG